MTPVARSFRQMFLCAFFTLKSCTSHRRWVPSSVLWRSLVHVPSASSGSQHSRTWEEVPLLLPLVRLGDARLNIQIG